MKAITRLSTTTIHDQLFIDDCALNIVAEEDLRRNVDLFAAGCTKCGLTIKTDKTVVMHQPSHETEHNSARITVNGNQLQTVDNFAYLGGIISYNTNIDDEVAGRLSEASKPASKAFSRLQASVCSRHSLHLNSKLEMYKAVVLRTLLYGVETWIVYARHARKPNLFHLNCLCRLLKLRWCQVLVYPGTDVSRHFQSSDEVIPWRDVAEVRYFHTEPTNCPICLYPPVAPRMGPCGHIYCWPCIYRFITYENDLLSRKCAVCTIFLRCSELKRVLMCPVKLPQVGQTCELVLMKRHRNIMFPLRFSENSAHIPVPNAEAVSSLFTRVAVATSVDIKNLVKRDQCCLETYLAECTSEDDLSCMIPYVETLLRELREELDCVGLINRYAHTPKTSPLVVSESEHVYTYYEDVHGLNIYLHSVNWRCLMTEYKDRELPCRISGTVVQIDRYSMNHDLRRRYRYLSHLPIGRPFYFVELDLQPPTVSQKTLDEMSGLLLARSHKREQQLQKELLLTLAKEEAENRIPTLPLGCRLVAHANLAEVPTDEDFVPLCQTSDVQPTKSCFRRSFASVSKVGASAVVDSHRIASFPERACNGANRQVGYICASELWPSLTEASSTPMPTSGAWGLGDSVHAPHSHPVEQDPSNTDELPAPAPPLTLDKGDHDRRSRRKKLRKPDLVDLDSLAKSLSLLPVNKGSS
ncbi:RING finger protein 10 [Sparganum proliferum]